MTATATPDVLQDPVISSLAHALAAANRKAEESGVVLAQNVVTIRQMTVDQIPVWRISYHPPVDFTRRGGGLLIEVSAEDATIRRVLNEQ